MARGAPVGLLIAGLLQLAAALGVHLAHRPPDWSSPELARSFRSEAVQEHGWLSVRGTQLVDQRGEPYVLRGVSLHGPQWFPPTPGWTVPSLVRMFGLGVVRVPAYVHAYSPRRSGEYWGGYLAQPERILRRVREVVHDAIAAGIYVIIDWHIQSPPGLQVEQAEAFFAQLSREYGRYPNVLYEIANEPARVDWDHIARYAERLIPVIRANAPDSVIIVGTPAFSKNILAPLTAPLPHDNILYALHFYAGNHPLDEVRSRATYVRNAGLPLIVTEWAASDAMMKTTDYDAAEAWVDYMEAQRLSWVAWSLGNKDELASLLLPEAPLSGPWTEADLTGAGRWMLPRLRGPIPITATLRGALGAPLRAAIPRALFGLAGRDVAPEGAAALAHRPDGRSDWSLLQSPARLRRGLTARRKRQPDAALWLLDWGLDDSTQTTAAGRTLWIAETLGALAEAGADGATFRPLDEADRAAHRLAADALRGALYPCESSHPALRCFLASPRGGPPTLLVLNAAPAEASVTLRIPGFDGAATLWRPGAAPLPIELSGGLRLPPWSVSAIAAPR